MLLCSALQQSAIDATKYDFCCVAHKTLHLEETRSAANCSCGRVWQNARAKFMQARLLRAIPKDGKYTKTTEVDLVVPPTADPVLF